jgi:diguanylate cyclase (GGDEF)-like protein
VSLTGLNQVNDTVGHSAGDDLILQLAERLRESVRLSDIVSRPGVDQEATEIAHLGGDQFTILLTKVHEASDAAIAAQRVLAKLAEPFVVEGREIVVTTSIGIGIYPQDGGDAGTLVRNSGAAMNEARGLGGNGYQFYSEAMNVANSRKLHIQSRLGGVIERDDLSLHYQPIRDAKNGHLTGAEALLRWTDSELGPIGPDEFIPIAEHGGLISAIGTWVLTTACEQVRAWQQAGYPQIRMSVNVSASQLSDSGWVEMVAETLRETQVSPGCLEFEITETTILQDEPRTIAAVTQIAKMGIGFALDDFGTGYSSLSHLRNLPVCRLKIDRSFVSEISESEQGAGLAGAIVTLAHGLQLEVVAEGVETQEQAQFLRSKGCDELQGYLLSRAVPAAEFERFLAPRKPE